MAVEIDADTRPVQSDGDLFDMGRLSRAVVTSDHDAAIEGETSQYGERCRPVEQVIRIQFGNMLVPCGKCRNLHIRVDVKQLANGNLFVGQADQSRLGKGNL